MSKYFTLLNLYTVIVIGQLILAVVAEFNEEYTRAIYEMTWAGLFMFFISKEKENTDE
jgi:hypothetical protein|tara:strand:+ start:934 stop:1107 length:174 start_codon:yes stop_codon:yes gene_type:complete